MLHYGVVFLVLALVAALFGFGDITGDTSAMARLMFIVLIVLTALSLLFGWLRHR